VLAAEHFLGLAGLDLTGKIVECAGEFFADRLAGLDPLRQDFEVLETALERLGELAVLFQATPALQQLLRSGLILPEVRRGDAFFDSG
jgi:hypothetical protein